MVAVLLLAVCYYYEIRFRKRKARVKLELSRILENVPETVWTEEDELKRSYVKKGDEISCGFFLCILNELVAERFLERKPFYGKNRKVLLFRLARQPE